MQRRPVHHEQIGIAGGEHARADTDRGAGEKCVGRRLNGVGQLHAAHLVILRGTQHARLGVSLLGVMRSLGQDDLFAIKVGLLHVHQAVEGRVFIAGNALAGVQHSIKGLA